ncbi:xaa-Pro aminopeptidase 3 isoform X1 [Aquila chrysaetos chrysaetos]|uniref:xaa-Pro aminopeptidase 3 isoform X1 n=1 Tax=Aquila chrysaetos chrysaetos TaxID=223781 RepID=UPI001B7D3DD6|nr:xaa-Pro aminopeptidase 3 isoform X1 [Aquila chrysaetos chrysaetos]
MSRLPARRLVAAVRGWRGFSVCKSCALRRFSIQPAQQKKIPNRYLGQPSPFTHPHLLKPGEVTPGLSQVEYALRRHKLMALIQKEAHGWDGSDHTVILLSNPTYYMSNDIPYIFHQDTNFLYLCGFQEPDSILVLQSIPGKALPSHKSILFVPRRDPSRELWDGPRSGTDGAIALTGVDEAYTIEEFRHLVAKLKGESNIVWYDLTKPVHTELHSDYMQTLAEIKARNKNHIQGIRHLVQNLRLIKSPAEIERMKKAGRVTAEAFIETMFASKSPVDEAFLYAKFEFECRARGADILAYPPVVAGGNRSNTLHYVKNNQLIKEETFPLALSVLEAGMLADLEMICRDRHTKDMTGCFWQKEASFVVLSSKDGELVLLDGGCESSCYVSDITRTWPINGRFTKPQAELYQAVLDIQKSCLSLCSPGMSLENIYSLMLSLIGQKLKELGILKNSITESHFFKAVRKYCPHHVGHYLGMDVHDTPDISRSLPLQPGMVITIEPGIYIPEDDVSAPERFRGIGVRIEDDVVITEDAPLILSADCPKEIYHIEQICGRSS